MHVLFQLHRPKMRKHREGCKTQSYIESGRSATITLENLDLTSTPKDIIAVSQMVCAASQRGIKLIETEGTFTWSSRGNPKL